MAEDIMVSAPWALPGNPLQGSQHPDWDFPSLPVPASRLAQGESPLIQVFSL